MKALRIASIESNVDVISERSKLSIGVIVFDGFSSSRMIVALVSAAKYEEATFAKFKAEEGADLDLVFVRTPLTEVTAPMSQGYRAISVSPTDQVS